MPTLLNFTKFARKIKMKLSYLFTLLALVGLLSCSKDATSINNDELIARQDAIIIQYFRENNIQNFQKHSTGFYYTFSKTTTASKATLGDSLSVNYTGNVLYGKVFDSNLNYAVYKPFNFRYLREKSDPKTSPPLVAFQDAAALLAKGERGLFYFPSRLLYGSSTANNPILYPNAILVFDIEMLDIFKQ